MIVYLIGAGPGDPGLFTLRGKALLEQADVVVYDYLASDALLGMARPDAELIYVGKQAGNHTMPQSEINRLLVDKAREGNIVARLKGGDPYIFGRGGEEAEALREAGVPFEEVPGISSTIAGPAYAGIPLTHRGYASSVTIITGHEDPTKPGSVHNWEALAASASTLVFVMGMKNLPDISHNLLQAGLDPRTPAAVIHWGTTPRHRSLLSTLADLPAKAVEEGFTSPSLIVVGKVASLRDRLNWFEHKPLLGKSVVVTRAREQASTLTAGLANLGAEVIECPAIKILPTSDAAPANAALEELRKYDWLIFTSVNGVKSFREMMRTKGLDARALAGLKVAAIGPATAGELSAFGITADFVPSSYVAEATAQGLIGLGMEGRRVLLPRALKARDALPNELRRAGAVVDIVPVYETAPATSRCDAVHERLSEGRLNCVTFGSSSTVDNFFALFTPELFREHPEVRFACIGPITARTLANYGFKADIQPSDFTIPALVRAVRHFFEKTSG